MALREDEDSTAIIDFFFSEFAQSKNKCCCHWAKKVSKRYP